MTELKQMATFIALGGIATASWFKRESFVSWEKLEDTLKKPSVSSWTHLTLLLAHVRISNGKMGIYREYIVKFEELKRFFGEMSLPTLINLFMGNTQHAVHNQYNELKRQEFHLGQFLAKVTVISNKEAKLDKTNL